MLRIILVVVGVLAMQGCGTFQDKTDRYREAARMAANPEHVEIYYRRDDNKSGFYERRCSGDACTIDLDAFIVPVRVP